MNQVLPKHGMQNLFKPEQLKFHQEPTEKIWFQQKDPTATHFLSGDPLGGQTGLCPEPSRGGRNACGSVSLGLSYAPM